ncbi:MAG: hypothetical protein L7F78_12945, partial [Syntrophales bacterium LBB04]|nr:hypothetical protein [Syntrophales bacterium LBB04]
KGFKFKWPTRQYAIRRFEFDQWLLQLAEPEFHLHGVREIRLEKGEYVVDDEYSAHYLIGAGGSHCPVYRNLFSKTNPKAQAALIVAQEEEFQYNLTRRSRNQKGKMIMRESRSKRKGYGSPPAKSGRRK